MNLREEIRRRFREQPPGTAESTRNLEAALEEARRAKAELAEVQKQLEQEQRAKSQLAEALMEVQIQLAKAKAYIAELKRQLFGSKGEPLSAEQEAQLEQLANDAQEQAKSPAPDSQEVLEEEEQSKLGLGLAVQRLFTRFDDHLSLYRLEHIFRERHGVEIPRQQMVQWIEHIAGWLKPIYEAMWQEMKAGNYLQIDETPVKVLDRDVSGKTARGYLWFYAVPREDVILEFCSSRGQEAPNKRLQGFQGTIQTDAYEVYEAVVKKNPKIERIGCLAHARRYFYKALQESLGEAVWFIGKIRELYRIEYAARALDHTERHALRQVQAPPLWAVLQTRAEELRPRLLPQSTMGKAVNYFLNECKALEGYLRDGRFEIDNNLIENAIRPTAVGRRRWLFIGHPQAGWRSAVIYSLLLSCRRRGINPQSYLSDVLNRLPSIKITEIHQLLPGHWKPSPPNTS